MRKSRPSVPGVPLPLPVTPPTVAPEPLAPEPTNRAARRGKSRTEPAHNKGAAGAHGPAARSRSAQGRRVNPVRRTG